MRWLARRTIFYLLLLPFARRSTGRPDRDPRVASRPAAASAGMPVPPRCPEARGVCRDVVPPLVDHGGRNVACLGREGFPTPEQLHAAAQPVGDPAEAAPARPAVRRGS